MRVQPMPSNLIPTMDEAEESLAQVYRTLFYMAGLAFIAGLAGQTGLLLVAWAFFSLALFLRQFQSRTAALVVAVMTALNLARVLTEAFFALPGNGSTLHGLLDLAHGVLGTAIDFVIAAVAVQAAFRFHKAQEAFNAALARAEKARRA
jgi:hypothetical protein